MVQRTSKSKVRHTNLTYEDLCCVRRVKATQIKAGTILARDGAWQNKRLVDYVVYCGVVDQASYNGQMVPRHLFTLGIRPLGQFYADGRMKISKRQELTEIQVYVTDPSNAGRDIGGWCVVEPIPVDKRQAGTLYATKSGKYLASPPKGGVIPHDPKIGRLSNLEPRTEAEFWAYNEWAAKVGRPLKKFGQSTPGPHNFPGYSANDLRHTKEPEVILAEFALKGGI